MKLQMPKTLHVVTSLVMPWPAATTSCYCHWPSSACTWVSVYTVLRKAPGFKSDSCAVQMTVLICTRDLKELRSLVTHNLQSILKDLATTPEEEQEEAADSQQWDRLFGPDIKNWQQMTVHEQDLRRAESQRYHAHSHSNSKFCGKCRLQLRGSCSFCTSIHSSVCILACI